MSAVLIQIMMLRWLQKTGHKPIVLMGGGTTKVGDPSFRAEERPLMTPDQIDDQHRRDQAGLYQLRHLRRPGRATRSWSTTPNGWTI